MKRIEKIGVPGYYIVKRVRGFNHVQYWSGNGTYETIATESCGQYGGPGNPGSPDIKPAGNPMVNHDINAAINSHAARIEFDGNDRRLLEVFKGITNS